MVQVELLSNVNETIRYSYQPEKNGEPGILSYNKTRDEAKIERLAEMDGKTEFYRTPVLNMIRENINNPPKSRLLTWY